MSVPRQRSVLDTRRHVWPGQRGTSSALPEPKLGDGRQLSDSQLRRIETCASKVPYTCEVVAETAALALGWAGVDVQPYRCEVCDLYHLTKTRSA